MNFTREPIIETIISPKDGSKLLVRNSKAESSEEYFVDALEVVSFGHAFFFRSLERPKSFLVPVSDYEVLEVKEARVALKNAPHERNIKIGGGREGPVRQQPQREQPVVEKEDKEEQEVSSAETADMTPEQRMDNKRRDRRRRSRHRRNPDEQEWKSQAEPSKREPEAPKRKEAAEGGGAEEETKVSSSMFTSLFPPPSKLISETLSRLKDQEVSEANPLPKPVEEKAPSEPEEKPSEDKQEPDTGSEPLHRVVVQAAETDAFSTHFSPLSGSFGFEPQI